MKQSSEQGFSLVEVMIITLLLAVFFIGYLQFYGNSITTNSSTRAKANAIRLAQENIEELKALDLGAVDRTSTEWTDLFNTQPDTVRIDGVNYAISRSIITTNLNSNIAAKNEYIPVRVQVQWNFHREQHQITVDTCMIAIN